MSEVLLVIAALSVSEEMFLDGFLHLYFSNSSRKILHRRRIPSMV